MLKNYFKIAIKVLKRNKLYTFISLFGISFTLMVLMLASSVLENELGNNPPLTKGDRMLFLPSLQGEGYARERVVKYDTTEVEGVQKIDSVITQKVMKENVNMSSSSSLGYKFYKDNISKMKTPELSSVFIDYAPLDVFPDGQKLSLNGNLTDANYWKIFDFKFMEGGPFKEEAVTNQANVIILRKSTAKKYFGEQSSYLGKELVWGLNGPFKVIGIVKDVSTSNRSVRADFFVPITWASPTDLDYSANGYFGSCVSVLLAKSESEVSSMEEELRTVENNLELIDGFDKFLILEKDRADVYAWSFIGSQKDREGKNFLMIVFGVLAFFLVIPILNLVNLNVTRIFERSSEIGVRKAFGAKTGDLLLQFLFENLIITFIGGVLGVGLTLLLINVLNNAEVFGTSKLTFNFTLLIISLLITFVFGLLSGFLPAWRISKTPVAGALKSGTL
jgi:putative ABC transport system permease protein